MLNFEKEFALDKKLAVKCLVEGLSKELKMKAPQIIFSLHGNSYAKLQRHIIKINMLRDNYWWVAAVVCHEVAHLTDYQKRGTSDHSFPFHIEEERVGALADIKPIYARRHCREYAALHIRISTNKEVRKIKPKYSWNGKYLKVEKSQAEYTPVIMAASDSPACMTGNDWLRSGKEYYGDSFDNVYSRACARSGAPHWTMKSLKSRWYKVIRKELC